MPVSAITRSLNGCLTCKNRKKKCDETRPICTRCINGDFKCLGYDYLDVPKVKGPRRRRKKVQAESELFDRVPTPSNYNPVTSGPPTIASCPCPRDSAHFHPSQITPPIQSNNIVRNPQVNSLDPDRIVQMFLFYSKPTPNSLQPFKPFPYPFPIALVLGDRIKRSSLSLKSAYIEARIKKAVSDGAGLSVGMQLINDFQRQITSTTVTPDMSPNDLAIHIGSMISLAFCTMHIVNTPVAYSLLRKSVPLFLALAAKFHQLWTDDLSLSIRHALALLDPSITHFAFLDTVIALVFGVVPLIHYDVTLTPVESPETSYLEWAHGCSASVITLLARVNSWRAARLMDPTHPTPTPEELEEFQACLEGWKTTIEYGDEPVLVMGRYAVQEIWRHAVLIYMHMGMCEADSANPQVEASVRQVAQLAATIEANHSLEVHMIIPCIIAAAAARKEKHRAILRKKIVTSREHRINLIRGADFVLVLDHLWHGAAAGGRPTTWQDYVDSRFAVLPIAL